MKAHRRLMQSLQNSTTEAKAMQAQKSYERKAGHTPEGRVIRPIKLETAATERKFTPVGGECVDCGSQQFYQYHDCPGQRRA